MAGQTITNAQVARARVFPDFINGRELCATEDPEIFQPEGWSAEDTEPARKICRRCPQVEPCLLWALKTHQPYGIWGATTPGQRTRLLKTMKNRGPQ